MLCRCQWANTGYGHRRCVPRDGMYLVRDGTYLVLDGTYLVLDGTYLVRDGTYLVRMGISSAQGRWRRDRGRRWPRDRGMGDFREIVVARDHGIEDGSEIVASEMAARWQRDCIRDGSEMAARWQRGDGRETRDGRLWPQPDPTQTPAGQRGRRGGEADVSSRLVSSRLAST